MKHTLLALGAAVALSAAATADQPARKAAVFTAKNGELVVLRYLCFLL